MFSSEIDIQNNSNIKKFFFKAAILPALLSFKLLM